MVKQIRSASLYHFDQFFTPYDNHYVLHLFLFYTLKYYTIINILKMVF